MNGSCGRFSNPTTNITIEGVRTDHSPTTVSSRSRWNHPNVVRQLRCRRSVVCIITTCGRRPDGVATPQRSDGTGSRIVPSSRLNPHRLLFLRPIAMLGGNFVELLQLPRKLGRLLFPPATGFLPPTGGIARIYRNQGNGTFNVLTAGLPSSAAAAAWINYDNDGDLDIVLAAGPFTPASQPTAFTGTMEGHSTTATSPCPRRHSRTRPTSTTTATWTWRWAEFLRNRRG